MNMTPLVVESMPLTGRHLIEASAGTGKTFNITRIFLRLLLERELPIENILIMTFTKDATEEIKSRIGDRLRTSLAQWDDLILTDPFYQQIAKTVAPDKAKLLMRKALLFLDEAAIFTIHGFCKRVLSQFAFDSGLSFSLQMESSCQEQTIEAVQDWYRVTAKQSPQDMLTIAQYWPEPSQFLDVFGRVLTGQNPLKLLDASSLKASFTTQSQAVKMLLEDQQSFLFEHLVDKQKGEKKQQRIEEFTALLRWFDEDVKSLDALSSIPAAFCDGRRIGRTSPVKAELNEIFTQVKALQKQLENSVGLLRKVDALAIAKCGIEHIRANITAKKQKLGLLSFDDLISVLAEKLAESEVSQLQRNALAVKLFEQYPVAMVDEFQDTDPHQFTILQSIYQHQAEAGLFLIGDPKQAIYGFRGGDIFTYLNARDFCHCQWVMDTNWRSTKPMIEGYNRLFYGDSLDSKGKDTFGYNIPYLPVSPSNTVDVGQFSDGDKALQFVSFVPDEPAKSVKAAYRSEMAAWTAQKVKRLLNDDSANIAAKDIAILVRDGTEANDITKAFTALNLSAVYLSNRNNLWHSEQASQLLTLLKGVLLLEQDRYFNAALASGLLGFQQASLVALQQDEYQWQSLKMSFKALRDDWHYRGFISFALQLLHHHMKVNDDNKERVLTNLLHLFELLQQASQKHHQPQELLFWFEQQMQLELADSEAELRLESDENLIKIVTQHGSKGLEYPVVFVPFATRTKNPLKVANRNVTVIEYHNEQGQLISSLEGDAQQKALMAEEAYAETIRLLYVAVTRAVQRCYVLVANFEQSHVSPLGKTLGWQSGIVPHDFLTRLAAEQPDSIGLTEVFDVEPIAVDSQTLPAQSELASAAEFHGNIERDWWLSSFTALSKNMRHGGVSTPDRDTDDNTVTEKAATNIRFDMAKGAQTGNLLHDLMEHCQFDQPQWGELLTRYRAKYTDVLEPWRDDELEKWLTQIINTPLMATEVAKEAEEGTNEALAGNVPSANCLSSISDTKVLKEAEFYFPMRDANSQKLTAALISHRRRVNPEKASKTIRLPEYKKLKGMMHGFIDLVFEMDGKYYVSDYKSTYLGKSIQDYSHHAMRKNIEDNYYDLQYLLYSLALHRLLKNRLANYSPEAHFGGIFYLYLRGMNGDGTSGVYYADVQPEELNRLDNIFAAKEQNPDISCASMSDEEGKY
ncbi:exodeoxyribonuclease V subunit beta [Thalassotalea euphylliae]|uniref:exodeoxyribonuclease V subunit beta n=1 Tax=Thalassotalea euphylliae TaxID=1655234 RepID=UPI003625C548